MGAEDGGMKRCGRVGRGGPRRVRDVALADWYARQRVPGAPAEPARLLGLADHGRPVEAGVMANLVVFDPQAPWVVDSFSSKSANSPYLGQGMTGRVRATVFEGMVVHSREKEPV